MKLRHRNNLLLLAFIHLLLFAYPLVSKTFHGHHGDHIQDEHSHVLSFDQPEESCPVCDFEFYRFVNAPQWHPNNFFASIPVYNSPAPNAKYPRLIHYFSLRAPPAV
jgi:hypothetical protein